MEEGTRMKPEIGGTVYGPGPSNPQKIPMEDPEDAVRMLRALNLTGDPDFDELLQSCIKILAVKGEDYTIGTGDRLHNFKTVAEFTGLRPEQVLGVYFYKHVAAVFAFIKNGGQSESEPIEGRIADCVNYMLLFQKMVRARRRGELK